MISILFAVDHEAALVRGALSDEDSFRLARLNCVVGTYAGQQISIGLIGMGEVTAKEKAEVFMKYFRPRLIILAGYAGALVSTVSKGEVFLAENYSSAGGFHLPQGLKSAQLVTVSKVVSSRADRETLSQQSKAVMVDMETAAVASVVESGKVPLVVIRAISDGLEDDLPTKALASAYDSLVQRPTPFSLLFYLFTHPGDVVPFARFVSGLGPVRKSLTRVVLEVIRLNPQVT